MKKFTLLILILLFPLSISAQVGVALPIDPNVRHGKLENGLTYYIRHNAYPEKRAEFYIAQKVGSMQEEEDQRGLAHFLEHMAFNGTKNYPGRKAMLNYLETIGAKFGANVNAYTSFDETVYNLSDIPVVREGIIDSCLLVLHDWSSFITLEDNEIDKERLIIKEEWRTRGNAQMRIWEAMLPDLFKDSKYAYRLPIGTVDVIENFKYQTIKDYYHKWYRPDLQAIIIVGDIDVDKVENKIKTMFADISKPVNPAERIYFPVPDNEAPIIATVTDPEAVGTNVMLFIKHDVFPEQMKKSEMGLMVSIVQSMASQMFTDRLMEISQKADSPLARAYAYDGSFFVSKSKDAWTIFATSKEGKVKETLATLLRENARIKRYGFTEAEVERAKASMLKDYEENYNNRNKQKNSTFVREYVTSFTEGEPIPGIEFEYNFFKKISPMLSATVFNEFSKQVISDKNNVITVSGPQKAGLTYPSKDELMAVYKTIEAENIEAYTETVSNEPLISQLPKAGKVVNSIKDPKLGTTVWTLSNGMKVVIKKTDFKDDEISMSSIAFGGTSIIPENDIYNANFAAYIPALGGVGNFSATDLKKVLAGKSASVQALITATTQTLHGSSSNKDMETLLQLTHLYFTAPRKDTDAFASTIEVVKSQLKNLESEPSFIMADTCAYTTYGNNARMKPMHFEDAAKLDYDRIIAIYNEIFANPGSFVFSFTGTIDEATFKPLVEQYLASLPAGNKAAKFKNVNLEILKGNHSKQFEQTMKNPKASVYDIYSGTIKRTQKNVVTLNALKQILDMVYVDKIREKEGGTYGVRTSVDCNRYPEGLTTIKMTYDTDPEKAINLNKLVHQELKNIAENGPNEEEFKKAKEYMAKKFQEDIKTNGYWNAILNTNYIFNQDYHSNYMTLLNSLTKEDIKLITKEVISQGNCAEVIMLPKK